MPPPTPIIRHALGNRSDASTVHGLPTSHSLPQTNTSSRKKNQKGSHHSHPPRLPSAPPMRHSKFTTALLKTHMVYEAETARKAFQRRNEPGRAGRRYKKLCVEKCFKILQVKCSVSEAIVARARMMLATDGMGSPARAREHEAKQACALWNIVIVRAGMSRFPLDEARRELKRAEMLLGEASQAVKDECELEKAGHLPGKASQAVVDEREDGDDEDELLEWEDVPIVAIQPRHPVLEDSSEVVEFSVGGPLV